MHGTLLEIESDAPNSSACEKSLPKKSELRAVGLGGGGGVGGGEREGDSSHPRSKLNGTTPLKSDDRPGLLPPNKRLHPYVRVVDG